MAYKSLPIPSTPKKETNQLITIQQAHKMISSNKFTQSMKKKQDEVPPKSNLKI